MEGNQKDRRLCGSQRRRGRVPGRPRHRLFTTPGDSEGPGQDRATEATGHFERRVSGVPKGDRRPHRRTEVTFDFGFWIRRGTMEKIVWISSVPAINRKSKTCGERRRTIQNRKSAGVLVLLVFLVGCVGMAEAQQPKKVPRIGYLNATSPSVKPTRIEAFRQGLRELGYVEGKTIVIEWRYAEGKLDRVGELAADLVRLKVDVIVTGGPTITPTVKKATTTIPIVMGYDNDPVGSGFVAS